MTGPKLNVGATIAGERPGTLASAKYVRSSASKARVVLDLIRGLDVRRADEVLQFTARGVAADVRKVLASAVANAIHNDLQEAEELYVLACFADEGPTLRRFRPRARGRATRIRKRTCHITVVVARMSDERLDVVQARQENRTAAGRRRAGTSAQSRRDRVERSRQRAEGLRAGVPTDAETDELPAGAHEAPDDGSIPAGHEIKGNATSMKYHVPEGRYYDLTNADVFFDTVEHAEAAGYDAPAADEAVVEEHVEAEADETEAEVVETDVAEAEAEAAVAEADLAEGAVAAPEDGSIPAGYEIKGNANSMKYHQPGGRYYDVTIAEVFFDTAEHAEAAGYEPPTGEGRTAEGSASDEAESNERASSESSDASDDEGKTAEGSASDEAESNERASSERDN